MLGNTEYYTVRSISAAFGVPPYHIINIVRSGELNGRRLNKEYIISGEDFKKWVETGNFEYKPRKSRKKE